MTHKPKLLDLFSGAGGAGYGYKLAGFHVTGVDNRPMPRYAGDRFIQADALEYLAAHGHEYDAIHASPPCQIHSQITRTAGTLENHEDLIEPTRELLKAIGKPYVIENVIGAPLQDAVKLCGTMFGLLVLRHRLFETNPPMPHFGNPSCKHERITVNAGRKPDREKNYHSVVGHFPDMEFAQEAMGIDWMNRDELSQAIPPAYTEYIGKYLLAAVAPKPTPPILALRTTSHAPGLRLALARRDALTFGGGARTQLEHSAGREKPAQNEVSLSRMIDGMGMALKTPQFASLAAHREAHRPSAGESAEREGTEKGERV